MSNPVVQFWFEFASTYSYVAAQRLHLVARSEGVAIEWRSFLLGPIFGHQGWNDSPFNIYPVKGRYMWRDLERLCAQYELPWKRPSQFPRGSVLAARVACAAQEEPWVGDFVRAIYRLNFVEDAPIGNHDVVVAALNEIGMPAADWLERALLQENKDLLRRQTEQAAALGIFGAPSFTTGDELFWGNDRMEAAMAWAKRPRAADVG